MQQVNSGGSLVDLGKAEMLESVDQLSWADVVEEGRVGATEHGHRFNGAAQQQPALIAAVGHHSGLLRAALYALATADAALVDHFGVVTAHADRLDRAIAH